MSKMLILTILAAALVGALLVSHWTAYNSGRSHERQQAFEKSAEILRERSQIDDETNNMDDAQLCLALGGEWVSDDRTCQ